MQTWDAITSRRTVRSFAGRPIPAADLDRILEAGRRSPSSQNWQPWDFILVTDRAQLRELARVFRGAGHVAESAATIAVIGPAQDNEFHRARRCPAPRPAALRRQPAEPRWRTSSSTACGRVVSKSSSRAQSGVTAMATICSYMART
jgi:nitroreductase